MGTGNNDKVAQRLSQMLTVSLFIILLSFFILLNSIATVDTKKKQTVIDSLVKNFYPLPGRSSENGDISDNVYEITNIKEKYSDFFSIDTNTAGKQIKIFANNRGSVIRIPSATLFSGVKKSINRSAFPFLKKICNIINSNNYPVDIICHTHNMPIDNAKKISNRELSVMRSYYLSEYFITKGDVLPKRFLAYGWGKHKPIVQNSTRQTRYFNNRIDIVLIHKKKPEKPKGFFIFKNFFFKVFENIK